MLNEMELEQMEGYARAIAAIQAAFHGAVVPPLTDRKRPTDFYYRYSERVQNEAYDPKAPEWLTNNRDKVMVFTPGCMVHLMPWIHQPPPGVYLPSSAAKCHVAMHRKQPDDGWGLASYMFGSEILYNIVKNLKSPPRFSETVFLDLVFMHDAEMSAAMSSDVSKFRAGASFLGDIIHLLEITDDAAAGRASTVFWARGDARAVVTVDENKEVHVQRAKWNANEARAGYTKWINWTIETTIRISDVLYLNKAQCVHNGKRVRKPGDED